MKHALAVLLLIATSYAQIPKAADGDMESTVGRTSAGQPVRHMWNAQRADPKLEACGFSKVANVQTAPVYRPETTQEQYNHGAELIWHGGHFHAMWINHPEGEDLPGQRILYSSSPDGVTWSGTAELFAPPGEVKVRAPGESRKPTGPRTKTYSFSIVDDRLTYRADLVVGKLLFRTEGAALRSVRLAPLQE